MWITVVIAMQRDEKLRYQGAAQRSATKSRFQYENACAALSRRDPWPTGHPKF